MDKVIYPAAFGTNDMNALRGVAVKEDIKHNEAIIFVPNKLLISVERAESSEIGFVFRNHDNVFKGNADKDFLILSVFIMFEM
jgi:hypothetical protein